MIALNKADITWQEYAEGGDLEKSILGFVRLWGHVTFPELLSALEPYFHVRGERALYLRPNLILWLGVSEQLTQILERMAKTGSLYFQPCHFLVYCCDGVMLRLPIARRQRPYTKPHWLPVTLCVISNDAAHHTCIP